MYNNICTAFSIGFEFSNPLVGIVLHSIYSMHVCTHWHLHKEHPIDIIVVIVIPTSTTLSLIPTDPQRCFPGKLLARLMLCNAS